MIIINFGYNLTHFVMFSYSGCAYILIFGSVESLSSDSLPILRSEMWKATRYVDIFGVTWKFSRMKPGRVTLCNKHKINIKITIIIINSTHSVVSIGMFEIESRLLTGLIMLILNVALA
jgi:hypothetical protein